MTASTRPMGRRARALIVVLALTAGACGGGGSEEGMDVGMDDMPGMSTAPADPMRAHLDRIARLPADSLAAALPGHRQMVANMIARMNREMSGMSMAADAAWNATVDSLRADLTDMPGLGVSDLAALMPAHGRRVGRLMDMHAAMMGR